MVRSLKYDVFEDMHGKGDILYSKNSLWCLGPDSKFRYVFVWIASWQWFDNFIILAIVLNSFMLASTDY